MIVGSCVKNGALPPPGWTKPAKNVETVFSPTTRKLEKGDIGGAHSIGSPIHVYPLYENGFRAHRGQPISQNHDESAELYAQFSEVAAQNEFAWNYPRKDSKEVIETVSEKNRMICFPCMLSLVCSETS